MKEGHILDEIRLSLGKQADVVLWRNAVVHAEYWDPRSGKTIHVHGGLPEGSADLVGILAPGRFLALEVKRPGEKPRPEQVRWLELVRAKGGFAAVVTSGADALDAVNRARQGLSS